jgi:hypothetical protein
VKVLAYCVNCIGEAMGVASLSVRNGGLLNYASKLL